MRKKILGLLFVAMLFAASLADAAIPPMPEIPTALPDAVRQPLIAKRGPLADKKLALIAEAENNKKTCTNIVVGSAQHRSCLELQKDFNARVETLRVEFEKLAGEIVAAVDKYTIKNLDPMVVDARVSPYGANLLSQVPELERSPAADRIRKGFQAVMTTPRDWPVALAWWQEALQRDPNNAALMRSVDLAQWMVDSKKRAQSASSYPEIDAFMRGDATGVNDLIEQAKKENAIQDAEAERMTKTINRQIKERAATPKEPELSLKSPTMAEMAIAGDRALSEQMFEDGLLYLNAGLYEAAEKMFREADFFRLFFDEGKPFSPSTNDKQDAK